MQANQQSERIERQRDGSQRASFERDASVRDSAEEERAGSLVAERATLPASWGQSPVTFEGGDARLRARGDKLVVRVSRFRLRWGVFRPS